MIPKLLSVTAIAMWLARPALSQAVGPVSTLNIANINASPDGFERPVIGVNGQHPGPLIRANKGANFRLTVANNLDDETMLRQTSIHWHGVFQRQSAWADGPEGVTQCPISQFGDSFQYRFTAGSEAGTYWYHSHFGTQYCDGLRGPMVIYDPNDPHRSRYDVDNENTIITLADWYHLQAPSITGGALSDATLINGKGRRPDGPATDIAIVNVQRNRRYRFRLVSLSCDPDYQFSIDGHRLTIIEADGQSTERHTVDRIRIFAGQRYSFILNANQTVGNYWIRAVPNIGRNGLPTFSSGGINSAILRYAGAPATDPTTSALETPVDLQEFNLRPFSNPTPPGGSGPADYNLQMNISILNGRFAINGASWTTPDSPVMVQLMNGVPAADVLPAGSMEILEKNKVVEVSIPGFALAGPHPFHLHGHAFSVIRSAGSSAPNYVNPVRRDVVSIGGASDNVTIRFLTDNAGPWFFHCHIEFHLAGGLGMVFLEAPGEITTPPTAWSNLCPRYDSLPASATAVTIVPTPA